MLKLLVRPGKVNKPIWGRVPPPSPSKSSLEKNASHLPLINLLFIAKLKLKVDKEVGSSTYTILQSNRMSVCLFAVDWSVRRTYGHTTISGDKKNVYP